MGAGEVEEMKTDHFVFCILVAALTIGILIGGTFEERAAKEHFDRQFTSAMTYYQGMQDGEKNTLRQEIKDCNEIRIQMVKSAEIQDYKLINLCVGNNSTWCK